MAAPNFYSYYALPGDHHMKPSERFARPDGPVFMVDEEKKQKNRVHQGPTFTYTFKEEQSHGHHSNSSTSTTYSPVSDNAGHGGENTTDTPSTSIEEVTSASDNQHVPLPQLPPKHPSRFLQNTHATRIELPELQTSFENEQDQEHQESRDQLSPLLASSPRKLDLRNHSSSNNTVTSQKSTTSSTTLSDRGREQQEEPTKSPPNQRRSFLTTFGIKNANQQSVISNNTTKSSGYGTRRRGNSADDSIVAEYKHLDTRSSSGSIHSSNEITRPEERESASFEDHPKSEAGPNETQEKRSSRSVAKGLVSNLGRRSKSANRIPIESTPVTQSHAAPASGQVGNDVKGVTTHSKWKAYRSRQARPTGMVAALQDDWVELPSISHVDNEHIHAQPGDLERNNPRGFDVTEHPGHYPMNLKQYSTTTPKPEGTPESSKANRQFLPKTPSPVKLSLKTLPSNWKNNKSSISTGSSDSHRVFGDNIAPQTSISTVSPSLPLEPSREHVRSPPFYMRGVFVNQKKKDYIPERGVSSQSSSSPNGRDSSPASPLTPPTLPSQFTTDSTPTRTVAAWPAESHVFGAAQAVIGNATIGPHVTPQFKNDIPASPPNTVKKQSIITPAFTLPTTQANTAKDRNIDSQLLNNAGTIEEDDVFANLLLQSPEEQRKRVFDLLRVSQSRKSSLYSTTTASSFRSSATSTPLPSEAYKDYKGRPRIEEAIVDYPETILANILDHLSFRSFKNLLHSSPKLYRAAYYDEAGESRFMDIIKQRFLAPYGYLPLPSTTTTSSNNNEKTNDTVMMKNKVHFTMRDLIVFQIGIEFSISEYCIFASEHKRSPLKLSITRTLRDSTRSFNKLVIRLKIQSQYIDSLYSPLSPSPSSATSTSISTRNGQKIENIREEEEETEKEETMPKLIKPHWVNYKRIDHQLSHNYQVYKSGRCLLLRAWVPCKTQWMSNEEILQVERELHRAGIWKFLRRGDLVRNVALGDIANEGILIFDGKYFRDLSYALDSIGHLPSWTNSLTFSPSHFHNQIVSAIPSEPVVHLNLTPWKDMIQKNLVLCKAKVDLTNSSGEQYKVTRYIYRTVIDLIPGTIISELLDKASGETETVHPDWAGQLIIETDGTTEAAKALLSRVIPVSRETTAQQHPAIPTSISNNRPYVILRNLSRPGLIFCRVVPDTGPSQQFGK